MDSIICRNKNQPIIIVFHAKKEISAYSFFNTNGTGGCTACFCQFVFEIRLKTVLRSDRVGMVDREVDRSFDARQYWWILSHILSDPALLSVLVRAAQ
ncbi:MAG TPA: hypothetical protein VI956_07625 [Nitrospirota bacterium]|nr:hypothetical protein [Nitrospirota bacterium]